MKIVIAEKTSPAGIKIFREQQGWNVITAEQINGDLAAQLSDADALVVRSAVNVDAKLLESASQLRVIGRAGVGVDNIDLDAATKKGIVVMNTPGANAVAVAEHTLALMLALARHLSRADSTTRAGKWEKKSLQGTELRGKTLGIVGLGRVGIEVAKRARAFEMNVVAHDPYVSQTAVRELGITLAGVDEVYAAADYLSLHVGLTPQTEGMINEAAINKMKKGVRIINCARGELINDAALATALKSGQVGGAALDVFTKEPPKDSPLLACENLIATPHIAGSTNEAQEAVGVQIAQQVKEYLKRGVIQNAVNVPSVTDEEYAEMHPYIEMAEKLGAFIAQVVDTDANLEEIGLGFSGKMAEWKTALIRNAAVKGILNQRLPEKANLVNAASVAAERGIRVVETKKPGTAVNVLSIILKTTAGETEARGTVLNGDSHRLAMISGINIEAPLNHNLVYLRNRDVPGVIGEVGTIMGKHGVNIANFSLGRAEKKGDVTEAVAVVSVDSDVPTAAIDELKKVKAVTEVRRVRL
ncbi:MAG: D-3-phosphoglycerate dehydrogenase [Acidobacteriaceae bacterium]|nr:D-3-phosphoglycerate dehydrogenase [Acidobacteriaceae bacterium]